jgi:RsiW-degrading membrane proteinase PrsW (M82 family)
MANEDNIRKTITGAIWLLGAGLLWVLWYDVHPKPEFLDTLLGTVLYVIVFFYILALRPIYGFVRRRII